MRVDTIFRLDATFDYWKPVTEGGATTYELVRSDEALVIPISGGAVSVITKEPMNVLGIVRNLKDRDGNLVFQVDGASYDMYVQNAEPQFNPFGVVIGWKHSLRRTIPLRVEAERLTNLSDLA